MLPLYVCHACKYSNTVVLGSLKLHNAGRKNLHPCHLYLVLLVTPLILRSAILFNAILFLFSSSIKTKF